MTRLEVLSTARELRDTIGRYTPTSLDEANGWFNRARQFLIKKGIDPKQGDGVVEILHNARVMTRAEILREIRHTKPETPGKVVTGGLELINN